MDRPPQLRITILFLVVLWSLLFLIGGCLDLRDEEENNGPNQGDYQRQYRGDSPREYPAVQP